MAVFEDREFVEEAVRSILEQSHREFELLVVDDRGGDGSIDVVRAFEDRRIRILTNEVNVGLTGSLNRGLAEARGRYLARMDADDVALPDRLARQVAFLDTHPEVGVVGGACELIDTVGTSVGQRILPASDLGIRW